MKELSPLLVIAAVMGCSDPVAEESEVTQAATLIAYGSYLGGDGNDIPMAMAKSADGGLVIVGSTRSTNFPGAGAAAVGEDIFITKLDAAGARVFTTLVSGAGSTDRANSVAIAANGTIHVGAQTNSTNILASAGAFQTTNGGGTDLLYLRLSAAGALEYVSYVGGNSNEFGGSIAVDGTDAIIVGSTGSPNLVTTAGAFRTTKTGQFDGFVVRIDANGGRVWSTFLGHDGGSFGPALAGVAVDSTGRIYVTGDTYAPMMATTAGAFDTVCDACGNSRRDAFVQVLDGAGTSLAYGTYFGGTQDETVLELALDSANAIYVGGATVSTDFPVSSGALRATAALTEGFVFALDPIDSGGGRKAATYIGGDGGDVVYGLAFLAAGTLAVSGATTNPTGIPITADAPQPTFGTAVNSGIVLHLAPDLATSSFGTFLGSSAVTLPIAVVSGSTIVVSRSNATDHIVTSNAAQATSGGGDDAVVTRLSEGAEPPAARKKADLEVTITDFDDPNRDGEEDMFFLQFDVTNHGPDDAFLVTVSVSAPVTDSAALVQNLGTDEGTAYQGQEEQIGDLAAGATRTFLSPKLGFSRSKRNDVVSVSAVVSAAMPEDPEPSNNSHIHVLRGDDRPNRGCSTGAPSTAASIILLLLLRRRRRHPRPF